jgi:hypothetical protein
MLKIANTNLRAVPFVWTAGNSPGDNRLGGDLLRIAA